MKNTLLSIAACTLMIITVLPITRSYEQSYVPLDCAEIDWWPMFHHDPTHSGYSSSAAPNNLTINWSIALGVAEIRSPAVVDGNVYVSVAGFSSENRKIQCYEADTGEHQWTVDTENRPVQTAPAISEGKVFVGLGGPPDHASQGAIWCLDAETGDRIWVFITNASSHSSPCLYEGRLYVGADRYLYCINASNGEYLWRYLTVKTVKSPAVAYGKVYISSGSGGMPPYGKIYCLDTVGNGNGTTDLIWIYQTELYTNIMGSPTIAYEKIYFTTDDDRVICLSSYDGSVEWNTNIETVSGDCAVAYEKVFVASSHPTSNLTCLNASTGEKIWNFTEYDISTSGPAVAEGKIYFGAQSSSNYKFYCLNVLDGRIVWDLAVGSFPFSTPAIANGKVYVGLDLFGLACFGGANHPPETPLLPLGPQTGSIGMTYVFSTWSSDADTNAIQYGWDWDGDSDVDEWTTYFPSDKVVDTIHVWTTPGEYAVKVKARDSNDGESSWSEPSLIHISVPDLNVRISGGLGLTLIIQNKGERDVTNITGRVSFDGLVWLPRNETSEVTIPILCVGEKVRFKIPVFGLGKTLITVALPYGEITRTACIIGPVVVIKRA